MQMQRSNCSEANPPLRLRRSLAQVYKSCFCIFTKLQISISILVLPALATNGDYKVLLVQPENQDWDVNLVARHPTNLIDLEMVKVKPGQEAQFQKLRNEYKVRSRSSNNVLDVVVFKVVRDTLEKLPADNLFNFPAEGNELTMTVYRDSAARDAALRENLKDPGYESTFDCIACTLINNQLARTYFPPYPADDAFPAYP